MGRLGGRGVGDDWPKVDDRASCSRRHAINEHAKKVRRGGSYTAVYEGGGRTWAVVLWRDERGALHCEVSE